jgi:hypothetical protein
MGNTENKEENVNLTENKENYFGFVNVSKF